MYIVVNVFILILVCFNFSLIYSASESTALNIDRQTVKPAKAWLLGFFFFCFKWLNHFKLTTILFLKYYQPNTIPFNIRNLLTITLTENLVIPSYYCRFKALH